MICVGTLVDAITLGASVGGMSVGCILGVDCNGCNCVGTGAITLGVLAGGINAGSTLGADCDE